jgi:hypothetical protein
METLSWTGDHAKYVSCSDASYAAQASCLRLRIGLRQSLTVEVSTVIFLSKPCYSLSQAEQMSIVNNDHMTGLPTIHSIRENSTTSSQKNCSIAQRVMSPGMSSCISLNARLAQM